MCTPEALAVAGVIQGTGSAIQAYSQAEQTEFQARQAENQGILYDIQADETRKEGEFINQQLRQETSQVLAQNIAQTAGSGIDIGGATAREVQESIAGVGIADEIQNRLNIRKRVRALRISAEESRATARALKKSAKIQKFTVPLAFFGSAASGGAQAGIAQKQISGGAA